MVVTKASNGTRSQAMRVMTAAIMTLHSLDEPVGSPQALTPALSARAISPESVS